MASRVKLKGIGMPNVFLMSVLDTDLQRSARGGGGIEGMISFLE